MCELVEWFVDQAGEQSSVGSVFDSLAASMRNQHVVYKMMVMIGRVRVGRRFED